MAEAPPAEPLATVPAQLVLLAAGRSSRMGEPKGLVSFRGRPWIEHQLECVAAAGVGRIVVVLGYDRARYLPVLEHAGVQLATNEAPERGPFSSLQCGLSRADPAAPVFVLPIDVPAAGPAVWQALSAALGATRSSAVDAVVPRLEARLEGRLGGVDGRRDPSEDRESAPSGGGGGHPVLLSSTFAARLLREPADARLDLLLRHRDTAVIRVPVHDPRVRLNLNRPEDWGTLSEG